MKHVASVEVLHNEQAMQSWTMPDKIECFFQAWRQALVMVRFKNRQNAAADALLVTIKNSGVSKRSL
jgi:uncharacterized protein YbcC (UPF0753/DUF2309 family)